MATKTKVNKTNLVCIGWMDGWMDVCIGMYVLVCMYWNVFIISEKIGLK